MRNKPLQFRQFEQNGGQQIHEKRENQRGQISLDQTLDKAIGFNRWFEKREEALLNSFGWQQGQFLCTCDFEHRVTTILIIIR